MTIKKLHLTFLLGLVMLQLNAQLKSPNDFFPHTIGEAFTPHHLLVDYFEDVADNSDQVEIVEYGLTNEGRPLILAFISSPENLAQLEAIRMNNLRKTGIESGDTDPALDRAIVWISCSVHGNEAAGSESAPLTLYSLVDKSNSNTQNWLKNTIVVLDPAVNPDGYSRYTNWHNRMAGDQIDINPEAREHNEEWPGGRTNHYYHDLNRDWAWQTQVESQQRMEIYNRWLPHVHADLHEQGVNAPYYFAPAAQPYHEYITKWQRDFQVTIGKNHAKHFDKNGWLYFTKEVFDLLYPSYGDTYPIYNGSIGMTYEQGGSGRAGRAIQMENGDTLTLKDRVDHHYTTSLSTVEAASENMRTLLDNFSEFFAMSRFNPPGKYKSFIVPVDDNNIKRIEALCTMLDKNGIEYGHVETNAELPGAYNYITGKDEDAYVTTRDLVISTDQPKGLFAQILLEPETALVDSLTYDITAWSLIHAYGLSAFASPSLLKVSRPFAYASKFINIEQSAYAYLIKWESLRDAKVLAQLLKKGIKARYANESFRVDNEEFPSGTIVITKADNRKNESFVETIEETGKQFNVEVFATNTGFMDAGPDFGSSAYSFIELPKVGLVIGEGTSSYSAGQIWHFFDRELAYPLQLFETRDLRYIPYDQINTLILAEGRYNLSSSASERLNEWIRGGGNLILIGYANRSFEDASGFNLSEYASEADEKTADRADEAAALDHRLDDYAGGARRSISYSIPGAIVKNKLDTTHPLAFALNDHYFSFENYFYALSTSYRFMECGLFGRGIFDKWLHWKWN